MPDELYCYCGPFRISLVPRGLLKPVILHLLRERPMHGFEIMEEVTTRTGGMWRPGPGAVYPALLSLEEKGFVTVGAEEERAKKPYTITQKGREAVEGLGDILEDWETSRDTLEGLLTVQLPR
ncbi:MAG: PadR family transcriptional regulator [Thermoplasmata archaeon]